MIEMFRVPYTQLCQLIRETDSSPGQFPLEHSSLPCSVRVRVEVRFVILVRGEMSGRGNVQREMCETRQ